MVGYIHFCSTATDEEEQEKIHINTLCPTNSLFYYLSLDCLFINQYKVAPAITVNHNY